MMFQPKPAPPIEAVQFKELQEGEIPVFDTFGPEPEWLKLAIADNRLFVEDSKLLLRDSLVLLGTCVEVSPLDFITREITRIDHSSFLGGYDAVTKPPGKRYPYPMSKEEIREVASALTGSIGACGNVANLGHALGIVDAAIQRVEPAHQPHSAEYIAQEVQDPIPKMFKPDKEHDYASMSDGDMLGAVGTDALRWAEAFIQTEEKHGGAARTAQDRANWKEHLLGWFANAIETAKASIETADTSPKVASKAAKLLGDEASTPEERSIAGSALAQTKKK